MLNKIVDEVYQSAVKQGLWDDMNQGRFYAWLVGEVAEALDECFRCEWDAEATELADVVILIMSYFGAQGWDFDKTLRNKIAFNKDRTRLKGNTPWDQGAAEEKT